MDKIIRIIAVIGYCLFEFIDGCLIIPILIGIQAFIVMSGPTVVVLNHKNSDNQCHYN